METFNDARFCHQCGLRTDGELAPKDSGDTTVLAQSIKGMYMVGTILRFLFPPTGFVVQHLSNEAKEKLAAGDVQGANKSYRSAQKWCWFSFVPFALIGFFIFYLAIFQ